MSDSRAVQYLDISSKKTLEIKSFPYSDEFAVDRRLIDTDKAKGHRLTMASPAGSAKKGMESNDLFGEQFVALKNSKIPGEEEQARYEHGINLTQAQENFSFTSLDYTGSLDGKKQIEGYCFGDHLVFAYSPKNYSIEILHYPEMPGDIYTRFLFDDNNFISKQLLDDDAVIFVLKPEAWQLIHNPVMQIHGKEYGANKRVAELDLGELIILLMQVNSDGKSVHGFQQRLDAFLNEKSLAKAKRRGESVEYLEKPENNFFVEVALGTFEEEARRIIEDKLLQEKNASSQLALDSMQKIVENPEGNNGVDALVEHLTTNAKLTHKLAQIHVQ